MNFSRGTGRNLRGEGGSPKEEVWKNSGWQWEDNFTGGAKGMCSRCTCLFVYGQIFSISAISGKLMYKSSQILTLTVASKLYITLIRSPSK